jgi:hypothetical protein
MTPRTPFDTLLAIYPDGHPKNSWQEVGDGVILLKSTLNQITPAPNSNHGEIIYSKNNIKTIFSSLGIQVSDEDIPEGRGTPIFPSLFTFIQSPATMTIEHNGIVEAENEGMIWLQNAETGAYKLTINGTGPGEYIASIWLVGATNDQWIQFKRSTSQSSKDVFTILFDSVTGGTAEEYIQPSPTIIPTTTPTSVSTQSPSTLPQTTSNTSQSSTVQSNTIPLLDDGKEKQTSFIGDFLKKTSLPVTSDPVSTDTQKILGANTEQVQKKKNTSGIILLSIGVALICTLIYKRNTVYEWVMRVKKKIW